MKNNHLLKISLAVTASLFLAQNSQAATFTWTPTAAGTFNWDDATSNWTSGFPNAAADIANLNSNLAGAETVNLNVPITVGVLNVGDPTTAFFAYTVNAGTAGSLIFNNSGAGATLSTTNAASATTNIINANVTLADNFSVNAQNTSAIRITGLVSESGGARALNKTGGASLFLTNNANSYTGATSITQGTINATLNADIPVSGASVLGNSASSIILGDANSTAGNLTNALTFTAGSDAGAYTISRGIDFAQTTSTGASTVLFQGDTAGGLNSNVLTLSGTINLGTGGVVNVARTQAIRASRTGIINITGAITQTAGVGNSNFNIGNTPQDPNVDGRGAGTTIFSNLARTYTAATNLLMGTIIIDGSVAATGASPIGTNTGGVNLTQGNSGNIFGGGNFVGTAVASRDTSVDTIRSLFLSTAGTTFARDTTIGNGSNTSGVLGIGGYTSSINIINGFQFGGTNTTGTTTFSGRINSGDYATGNSSTNVITLGSNIALLAESSATSAFTGIINDSSSSMTDTRVTINQFRNHSNIDAVNNTSGNISSSGGNSGGPTGAGPDGIVDTTANVLVGTAKTGTVVLGAANTFAGTTEVLGGTLQLANTNALGFGGRQGNRTGTTTVASGAALDLNGTININEPIILNGTGITSGGALINNSVTTATIGNGIAGIQTNALYGSGTNLATAPTVTISGTGTGATATSSLGFTSASITSITSGGTGWVVGDTVNLTVAVGATGAGATARVTSVSSGAITGLAIDNPGSGYTTAPTGFTKNTSVAGAGTLSLTGNATSFAVTGVTLTAAGTGYTGTPTYTFGSGDATAGSLVLSSVTLASDSSTGGSGNITINAVVGESGGARVLTKVGAGTLALTGANTYTGGTTVTGGILLANNTSGSATGTGALSVGTGSTLGGSGTIIGDVSVNGTLSAGNSIESLATGAVTLNSGSTLVNEVNNSVAASVGSDLVTATGSLNLNGTITLTLSNLGAGVFADSTKFTLISYTGPLSGSGLFNVNGSGTVADDGLFAFNGQNWLLNYNDTVAGANFSADLTSPNFVTITAVPEPGTWSMLAGGFAALAFVQARRRRLKA